MEATRARSPQPAVAPPAPPAAPTSNGDASRAAAAAAPPVERRRSSREAQVTAATLHPASGDTSLERHVLVCNLSLGGVGFRSPHRFVPGEVYRITLGAGPLFLNARLRIANCRRRPDATFDVGAEFC